MFTLDTDPEEIIIHPQFNAPNLCRSTIRVRRWQDKTMRALLSRPPQAAVVESCINLQTRVWEFCDDDLKSAVLSYLERNHG